MKKCPECNAPYESVRKFNSGNPMTFLLPTCDCEADRITREWEERFAAREQRP